MIRAGSTLQYNIVRTLIEKLRLGDAHGYYDNEIYKFPESLFIEWLNDESLHVIKMHDLHSKTFNNKNNPRLKICYIYRDIRDVAVSIKNKWGSEEENLLAMLDKAVNIYYDIKKFPDVLWQKYEDMKGNLPQAVKEIATFLDINIEEEVINTVARDCSLENMEKISKSMKLIFIEKLLIFMRLLMPQKLRSLLSKSTVLRRKVAVYDKRTLIHPGHISENAGTIGVWQSALNKHEIYTITKRYKTWLLETGYLIEDRE